MAPNMTFAELASEEQIQRTAQALEANGMRTYIADNGDEARRIILELLPEGGRGRLMANPARLIRFCWSMVKAGQIGSL